MTRACASSARCTRSVRSMLLGSLRRLQEGGAAGRSTRRVPVEQRDIVVSAQASGAIQPDTTVEVKSKASGEILQLHAETGQLVKRGALLVRIDPRNAAEHAGPGPGRSRRGPGQAHQRHQPEAAGRRAVQDPVDHRAGARDRRCSTTPTPSAQVVRAQVAVDNAQDPARGHRRPRADHRHHHREGRRAGHGHRLGHHERRRRHHAAQDGRPRTWCRCGRWWMRPTSGRSSPASCATVTVDAYPQPPVRGHGAQDRAAGADRAERHHVPGAGPDREPGGLLRPGMNAEVEIHVGQRDERARGAQRGAPHPARRGLGGAGAGALAGGGADSSWRPAPPGGAGERLGSRRDSAAAGRRWRDGARDSAGRRGAIRPRHGADGVVQPGRAGRLRQAGGPGAGPAAPRASAAATSSS